MRTLVHFTVDVEGSIAGGWASAERFPIGTRQRVLCQNKSGAFGVPLLAEELARHGMVGTFFVEVFQTLIFGRDDLQPAVDLLLEWGQDVQLHVHPTFRDYAEYMKTGRGQPPSSFPKGSDSMSAYNLAQQRSLLKEACDLFDQIVGQRPTAFRAGRWAANTNTLRALSMLGIELDSSYNRCYERDVSFRNEGLKANWPQKLHGVWELPLTVAAVKLPKPRGFKPLDIGALSFPEMRRILDDAHSMGLPHVTAVMHSFTTVKPRDVAYSEFRPDKIVIRRLRQLLDYLVATSDRFTVSPVLAPTTPLPPEPSGGELIPQLGFWRPAVRKAVQAVNRLYWL